MPVNYGSIIDEHNAVRGSAGLFDVSHMGRLRILGPDRLAFIERMLPTQVRGVETGFVLYSFLCREDGTAIDDITLAIFEDELRMAPNASNREDVLAWLNAHTESYDVEIIDTTFDTGMLALQGPDSVAMLSKHCPADLGGIGYYCFEESEFDGAPMVAYRTGYTGEDGFELVMDRSVAGAVWDALIGDGVQPCGLGARDTLRMEACFPLYGHELGGDLTPVEARLGFAINSDADYIGAETLRRQKAEGASRRMIAFRLEGRQIARQGCEILMDGEKAGWVSSGTFSPTLQQSVGLGFVQTEFSKPGTPGLAAQIRNRQIPLEAVKIPLVPKRVAKRK